MSSKRKNTPTKLSKEERLSGHTSPGLNACSPDDLDLDSDTDGEQDRGQFLQEATTGHSKHDTSPQFSSEAGRDTTVRGEGESSDIVGLEEDEDEEGSERQHFSEPLGESVNFDIDEGEEDAASIRSAGATGAAADLGGADYVSDSELDTVRDPNPHGLTSDSNGAALIASSSTASLTSSTNKSTSLSSTSTAGSFNNNNNNNNNTNNNNNKRSMETVLRKLSSKASDVAIETAMASSDNQGERPMSPKVMDTVQAVLAGEATLSEKERQISEMINHLQNIRENLSKQKDQEPRGRQSPEKPRRQGKEKDRVLPGDGPARYSETKTRPV
ncbi:probable serine/threonine-protein kinase ifkA, partial [Aplysia californica]|uniref:Probable serine/threonine-protein kinase ifkA n=1 Tax=Aplysia californica TaxID=6500 RepID=A0ABM1AF33_APLCA